MPVSHLSTSDWAAGAQLGIGTAQGTGSLTGALGRALEPGTADRAAATAAEIRTDGALIAARQLVHRTSAS